MIAQDVNTLAVLAAAAENGNGGFRAMLEALPIAAYTTDAEGRLTWFNPAAVKLSGRVPEIGSDRWCVDWRPLRLRTADRCRAISSRWRSHSKAEKP